MGREREARLQGIVDACARNKPSPIQLRKSIEANFGVTEQTAIKYIESLRGAGRLVQEDDRLVPGPNASVNGSQANGNESPERVGPSSLEDRVAALEQRVEALEAELGESS